MKKFLIPLVALSAHFWAHDLQGKSGNDTPGYSEVVQSAMLKGSSKELSRYFQQELHLELGRICGTFPKKQAEYFLSEFFNQYPPEDFEVIHNGETSDKTRFIMGHFSAEGKTFSILVKAKLDQKGIMKICELSMSTP